MLFQRIMKEDEYLVQDHIHNQKKKDSKKINFLFNNRFLFKLY